MKSLLIAAALLAVLSAPDIAQADALSCPGAEKAVHDVIVGLPLLMDEIAAQHAKGRSPAQMRKWVTQPTTWLGKGSGPSTTDSKTAKASANSTTRNPLGNTPPPT